MSKTDRKCLECDAPVGRHGGKDRCSIHYARMKYRENPSRASKRAIAWSAANQERYKANRKRYQQHRKPGHYAQGWTEALVVECLQLQHNKCAVCLREIDLSSLTRDHDHIELKARGLLCQACNISLGYYEKWQRSAGLVLEPYDRYLSSPPAAIFR